MLDMEAVEKSFAKLAQGMKLIKANENTTSRKIERLNKRMSTKNPAVESFERQKGRLPGTPKETNTMKSASVLKNLAPGDIGRAFQRLKKGWG